MVRCGFHELRITSLSSTFEHGSAGVGHGKSAVIEVSVAVDDVDVVAFAAAEHPHHMRALVGRQHGIAFNIRSVETYHII